MIRALNYPRPMLEPVILDLVAANFQEPGNALIRFNPDIAQAFTADDITDLMAWYADGDTSNENYVTLELLPRLVDIITPTWMINTTQTTTYNLSLTEKLSAMILEEAGSIGGQSGRFYAKFCASGRHAVWAEGRLYASVDTLDGDGDYSTGELYIPFWMTDQLLSASDYYDRITVTHPLFDIKRLIDVDVLESDSVRDKLASYFETYNLRVPPTYYV